MDANTFAASRISSHREAELQRELAFRSAQAARRGHRAEPAPARDAAAVSLHFLAVMRLMGTI